VKLLFVSLVVGALLMWLDIRPADILRGVQDFVNRIYALASARCGSCSTICSPGR